MTPQLRALLVAVGFTVLTGGVLVNVYYPTPASRSVAELRDAGVALGQNLILTCPERLTDQTIKRISRNQPGFLRPGSHYATVARNAQCFNPDGGICITAGGVARVANLEGHLVIVSKRVDLDGGGIDAGDVADGGDSNAIDDSTSFGDCTVVRQADFDAGNGAPWSGGINSILAIPSACVVPNCWTRPDGGWDDNAVVDCKFGGVYAETDGGPRWRGCNVGPGSLAVGAACVPAACSVVSQWPPDPPDWL